MVNYILCFMVGIGAAMFIPGDLMKSCGLTLMINSVILAIRYNEED